MNDKQRANPRRLAEAAKLAQMGHGSWFTPTEVHDLRAATSPDVVLGLLDHGNDLAKRNIELLARLEER